MSESPHATEPAPTPKQQQALAHSRGRICKVRSCTVCAPLRESRRLKKAQRKADAQAQAHSKGEPCGRNSCSVPACVAARHAVAETSAPAGHSVDDLTDDPERGASSTGRAAPCGTAVRVRDLRRSGVRRRLRTGTCPAPPGPTTLQVDRVHQPDLRGEPHDPLTATGHPQPRLRCTSDDPVQPKCHANVGGGGRWVVRGRRRSWRGRGRSRSRPARRRRRRGRSPDRPAEPDGPTPATRRGT